MPELGFGISLDEEAVRAFGAIREAATAAGIEPFDRDAFLLLKPVAELVHASRPSGGVGEAIEELVAMLHLSWLWWAMGGETIEITGEDLRRIVAGPDPAARASAPPTVRAVVPPPRRVWGTPTGAGVEPLDGWIAARRGGRLDVVAFFGGRPDREGATVVAVGGPAPVGLARVDGSRLFATTLPGGDAAGLFSITGMEELLALAWRAEHWSAERR